MIDLTMVIDEAKEVIARPLESPVQRQEALTKVNNQCLS